jgi:hypothetical protein
MSNIMIDIESLDIAHSTVILTIGAVLFDPRGTGIIDRLSLRPTMDDQVALGRTVNEGTISWWGMQSDAAQEEAFGEHGRIPFKDTMEKLYKFCWNRKAVWSNGATFDCMVMESAWHQLDVKVPWPYWTIRDTRTLYEIAGVSLKDGKHTTAHSALADAEHQAITVQRAYKKLIAAGVVAR